MYLLSNPTLRVVPRKFAEALDVETVSTKELARTGQVVIKVVDDWVPIRINLEWVAAFRLVVQDGQPVVGEVRVFPAENIDAARPDDGSWSAAALGRRAKVPAGGMRARLLKNDVKWGPVEDLIRQLAAVAPVILEHVNDENLGELFSKASKQGARQRGKPDSFYAKIAKEYVRLLGQRIRNPIGKLAESRNTPQPRMRDMVHEARRRELLTRKSQGVAGGQLTQKALQVLKADKEANRGSKRSEKRKP